MSYKLLVLDLDGTLTNSKKEITPFTRKTLLQAQEKGLHLVLASGRPTYGIVPVLYNRSKEAGLAILSYNGKYILMEWPVSSKNCFEKNTYVFFQRHLHQYRHRPMPIPA